MTSRQSLLSLGCLMVTGLVAGPAVGQQPTAQPNAREARPAPQPMQLSVELEQVLKTWEDRSSKYKRLQGEHDRYMYEPSVGREVRATGQFFFEAPDRGRIDIDPVEIAPNTVSQRKDVSGAPLRVVSAQVEKWICDGKQVIGMTESSGQKQYSLVEIPPQMQGENVVDGPLPFLFGVSAEKLKARYRMSLGSRHSWNPQDGSGQVHVVAYPTRKQDAQNWQRAEVMLDGRWFMPLAIRLRDGIEDYSSETVYVFNLKTMKADQSWQGTGLRAALLGFDPFKPNLRGYKLLEQHRVQPVNHAELDRGMQGRSKPQ